MNVTEGTSAATAMSVSSTGPQYAVEQSAGVATSSASGRPPARVADTSWVWSPHGSGARVHSGLDARRGLDGGCRDRRHRVADQRNRDGGRIERLHGQHPDAGGTEVDRQVVDARLGEQGVEREVAEQVGVGVVGVVIGAVIVIDDPTHHRAPVDDLAVEADGDLHLGRLGDVELADVDDGERDALLPPGGDHVIGAEEPDELGGRRCRAGRAAAGRDGERSGAAHEEAASCHRTVRHRAATLPRTGVGGRDRAGLAHRADSPGGPIGVGRPGPVRREQVGCGSRG